MSGKKSCSKNTDKSKNIIPTDYKFSFKFYLDSSDYNCEVVIKDLQKFFSEWVWIIHDKDTLTYDKDRVRLCHLGHKRNASGAFRSCCRRYRPKLAKPHIHFYGRNNCHCKTSIRSMVRYLHLPYSYNFRPKEFGFAHEWLACVKYTVHRNAPDKYQYPLTDCVTNLRNLGDLIEGRPSVNEELHVLYELLDEAKRAHEPLPYYELVRKLALRGCTFAFLRSSMVKHISESYQFYELGQVVQ